MTFPSFTRRLLIAIVFVIAVVGAAASLGLQTRTGDVVVIDGEHDDMVFAAGGEVSLSLSTPDDVFAVGGNLDATNVSADHLSLAGGDIVLTGLAVNDVLVAGGDVLFIDGTIQDDIIAAAADLTLRRDLNVSGSAILSGASITLDAAIGADLKATAERIRMNGPVGGDVEVRATTLVIGPDTQIGGDLRHRSGTIEIAEGALITGETIALEPRQGPNIEPVLHRASVMVALFGVLIVLGIVVLVLTTVLALPGLMNRSREMMVAQPLATLGIGFLISVATPALIALMFATVLGIPLGMLIIAICLTLTPLAFAASVYAIAMRGRRMLAGAHDNAPGLRSRFGWTFLVALAVIMVGLIPIVGGVIWLLAFVFGLGAVASQAWLSLSGPAETPRPMPAL